MSRRLSLAFPSMVFVYGLSVLFAPRPTLAAAANCDLNACISECQKASGIVGVGRSCTSSCLQTMEERKKEGQCK